MLACLLLGACRRDAQEIKFRQITWDTSQCPNDAGKACIKWSNFVKSGAQECACDSGRPATHMHNGDMIQFGPGVGWIDKNIGTGPALVKVIGPDGGPLWLPPWGDK